MGKSELCPLGKEITTKSECEDALKDAYLLGITLKSNDIVYGSWDHVPYQCSYQPSGDQGCLDTMHRWSSGLTARLLAGLNELSDRIPSHCKVGWIWLRIRCAERSVSNCTLPKVQTLRHLHCCGEWGELCEKNVSLK